MVAMVAPAMRRWLISWRYPSIWPALSVQLLRSWYFFYLAFPGAAARARRDDLALLRRMWTLSAPGFMPGPERDAAIAGLRPVGVLEAALAYYRCFFGLFDPRSPSRKLLCADVQAPTCLVAGAQDKAIDIRSFEALASPDQFPGGMTLERIEGAGHFPHLERPEVVTPLVVRWLDRHRT